jgi:CelD/BcsL family acetyltransferase involved in cellulose biosynthesis
MTTIRLLKPADLTSDLLAAWSEIQLANPEMDSPYFRPEFTLAVADIRDDVRIAVIDTADGPAGFFPFQGSRLGSGRPVGGRLSDYHGLIAKPGLGLTARQLLRACGLRSWSFDHLPTSQSLFAGNWIATAESPHLDLSSGFDAYLAERQAKTADVKGVPYKMRKLERDYGPARVELISNDRQAFQTLLGWKSEQYQRTGLSDVFAYEWTSRVVKRIWAERSDSFAGWLSTLSVGDKLVAAHFAMRSFGTVHSWFPGYDPEFSKYSPGSLLLYEMARLGSAAGITKIDLGKGTERYKLAFANGGRLLAEGTVNRSRLSRQVGSSLRSLRTWLKTGPLARPTEASAKVLRPMRERLSFK